MQREVHARRSKQRQRQRLARTRLVGAIDDAVIHRREIGRVEIITQTVQLLRVEIALDMNLLGKGEVHRYGESAHADLQRDVVVLPQPSELLDVVVSKQVGPSKRGFIVPWTSDEAEGQTRVGASSRRRAYPHKRVASSHPCAQILAGREALECIAKVGSIRVVDFAHSSNGCERVGYLFSGVKATVHNPLSARHPIHCSMTPGSLHGTRLSCHSLAGGPNAGRPLLNRVSLRRTAYRMFAVSALRGYTSAAAHCWN